MGRGLRRGPKTLTLPPAVLFWRELCATPRDFIGTLPAAVGCTQDSGTLSRTRSAAGHRWFLRFSTLSKVERQQLEMHAFDLARGYRHARERNAVMDWQIALGHEKRLAQVLAQRLARVEGREDLGARLDRLLLCAPLATLARQRLGEVRVTRRPDGGVLAISCWHARSRRRGSWSAGPRSSLARLATEYRGGYPITFCLRYVTADGFGRRCELRDDALQPRLTSIDETAAVLSVVPPTLSA